MRSSPDTRSVAVTVKGSVEASPSFANRTRVATSAPPLTGGSGNTSGSTSVVSAGSLPPKPDSRSPTASPARSSAERATCAARFTASETSFFGSSGMPSPLPPLSRELRHEQLRVQRRDQVLERLGAGGHELDRAIRVHLAREPRHQDLDLLLDQSLESTLVTQGVIDREPDPLVVAAGSKAADRLDDLHVARRVAAAVRREHVQLGEPCDHLARDVVAAVQLGGGDALLLPRHRRLEHAVLELDQRPRALGVLGEHPLDHLERHEALLLELLDQPHALHEVGRVVRHVARGANRLRQKALAQVVLDRAGAHPARLGQLAHLEQAVAVGGGRRLRAHARKLPWAPAGGPATAASSSSASSSPPEYPSPSSTARVSAPSAGPGPCGAPGVRLSFTGTPRRRTGSSTPGWSSSTTISRARTSSESSASSRASTGSRQQSCSDAKAVHSSRVRPRKIRSTSAWASEPGASN